jgi:3-oxoacyl-(acyl-carrier-protein) synthase
VYVRAAGAVTAAGVGLEALRAATAETGWLPELGLARPDGPPLPVVTCRDFRPKEHLSPLLARRLNQPAKLLAVAAHEALTALGRPLPWEDTRFAVTCGTTNAGTSAILEILQVVFLGNPDQSPPAQFLATIAHAPASQVSILEELRGPNVTFAEKQVGGLRALVEASRLLDRSRADAVLACGVDEAHWLTAEGYRRLGAARRPGGAGMVLGEGAIALALALTPGPRPLALLAGWGSASTPALPWCYPDRADGLVRACQLALAMAGVVPAEVDSLCTFANGVPRLDRLEEAMVRTVFGDHRPSVINMAPLGEGSFAGSLRALAAIGAIAGRLQPCWPPPEHLAALGCAGCTDRPRCVLVPGVAAGGSAVAVVLCHTQ